MGTEIITIVDIEPAKRRFYQYKSPMLTYEVNIDRIVVSNKVPFGKKVFKYFVR